MAKGLKSVFIWSAVGLVGLLFLLFIAGVAVGFASAHGSVDVDQALLWVMVAFAILIMAGSLASGVAWMRSIDEAAREAHKSAWYWGGTAGLCVGGVFVILASLPHAETLALPTFFNDRTDPAAYLATGAFGMLLLMMIGYTVAWAWWWWKRR